MGSISTLKGTSILKPLYGTSDFEILDQVHKKFNGGEGVPICVIFLMYVPF